MSCCKYLRTFLRRPLALLLILIALVMQRSAIAGEIDKLLALPEDKIDIGIVALTLAKEFYPNLDVAAYSSKIDILAEKVRWLARGTQDPEQRVRVLNTVLFRQEGFRYDRRPFSRSKQDYYFLNGILDTKQGLCYTMPLLYIAVAQRLGYPVYAVAAPDHLFVRYVDPQLREQNIETTSGGKYFPDEIYVEDFFIGQKGRKSGSYLRTLSYREFLGTMVSANAVLHSWQGKNGQKSLKYLEMAVRLHPRHANHHINLASAYLKKSRTVTGAAAANYREKSEHHAIKAHDLGFVGSEQIAIGRKIRGG